MAETVARFDNRVTSYVRGRPHYPAALLACLVAAYGLGPRSVVADVGAGTGLLTRLLLTAGCTVHAVEPNAHMRTAADALLGGHPGYISRAGSAEATTLPDRSVDFIVAGQAFHWFDPASAQVEFRRILRPGGWVALIWNVRRETGTLFLAGYQALIEQFGVDYTQVDHTHVVDADRLSRFFGADGYTQHTFANRQSLDLAGVIDRITSTSYMPAPDHPTYPALLAAIHTLFATTAQQGRAIMEYTTNLYIGRLPTHP
ncbi:MAG TPA: SAM-dependent methyltransferase [Chloroflexi bacterium]|nr:SAM-dependent methyltransferase [Chloroflexota bacterium]HHW85245.1 class I SAM-dependent methyltransferase [Chloroflexota bacterium]